LLTVGFATVSGKRPSTSTLSNHVAYNQHAKSCSGFSNSIFDAV
uniref:Transposase n=1 Tax=Brugia timori TaxID=42155 RepID=A0A0R3QE93_9BILA